MLLTISFIIITNATSFVTDETSISTQSIDITIAFSAPTIQQTDHGELLLIEDTEQLGAPGEPLLPVKTVKILIPPETTLDHISVQPTPPMLLPRPCTLAVAQEIQPFNTLNTSHTNDLKATIKNSTEPYPHYFYKNRGIEYIHGYPIIILNLYPAKYVPNTKQIYLYPTINVTITFSETTNNRQIYTPSPSHIPQDIRAVQDIIINPRNIPLYETEEIPPQSATQQGLTRQDEHYDYVIITNEQLRDAEANFTFYDLINAKQAQGLNATIITVEDIQKTPAYWWNGYFGDGQAQFNDTQAQIRNFIKDAYATWETRYILLGGDGDAHTNGSECEHAIIPARTLTSLLLIGLSEYIPSDIYYAALDGSWNNPEHPFPSTADITLSDPGIQGTSTGFLTGPTTDTVDYHVGADSLRWTVQNNETTRAQCILTIEPPYHDLSDKNWLHFHIKTPQPNYKLGNVIFTSADGKKTSFIAENIPIYLWDITPNTWQSEHIYLHTLINSDTFSWNNVAKITIDLICNSPQIGEHINIDGLYVSSYTNQFWGEPGEDDLIPEVYLGRMPVDTPTELSHVIEKTLSYENSDHEQYLRDIWMIGENLGFGGPAEWGGNYKDEIKLGSTSYGYTTQGIPPQYDVYTLYDRYWEQNGWPEPDRGTGGWSPTNVTTIINNNLHIINHLGHGNNYHVMKLDDPVHARTNQSNHNLMIQGPSHDIHQNLTNDHFFFLYTQACLPGAFDNIFPTAPADIHGEATPVPYDAVIEHILTAEHGAFACVANTRYGLGSADLNGPSQHFDRHFFEALFNQNKRQIGEAFHSSRIENIDRISNMGVRYCYYGTTLFGDPAVAIKNPPPPSHDLALTQLNIHPYYVQNTTNSFNITLFNRGFNDEYNITILLHIDNNTASTYYHPYLQNQTYANITIALPTLPLGTYDIAMEILPVPGESYLENNRKADEISIVTTAPLKICLLNSLGADMSTNIYDIIDSNWESYGEIPVIIDYTSLNYEGITYEDLEDSEADMLIIDFAWYVPPIFYYEFTPEELEAIRCYVNQGNRLLITAESFYGNNKQLLPLIGLNEELPQLFTGGKGNLTVYAPTHPLFEQLPNPFPSNSTTFFPSDDELWNANDLHPITPGTILARTPDNTCAVIIHNNSLYFTSLVANLYLTEHDLQLLYNAMTFENTNIDFYASCNGPYVQSVDTPIQFIGSAIGGTPPYSWQWNFGDGNTSIQQTPAHSYAKPGVYQATASVSDTNGHTRAFTTQVTVIHPPYSTLYVDDDYSESTPGWNLTRFPSIQPAVDLAGLHNTIHVNDGYYTENIHIPRSMHLYSENNVTTIIEGQTSHHVIDISSDQVTITNFTITSNKPPIPPFIAGIHINSDDNRIIQNIITDTDHGIYVERNTNITLIKNKIHSNSQHGILLDETRHSLISKNILSQNKESGIYLRDTYYNTITQNSLSQNSQGGITLYTSYQSRIHNNTFHKNGILIQSPWFVDWNSHTINNNLLDGKHIRYYANIKNAYISEPAAQVILANCTNVTLENQCLSQSEIGVQLGYCNHNIITNNVITHNTHHGIYTAFSENTTITTNTITNNNENGVKFDLESHNNTIHHNTITQSHTGISVNQQSNNITIHNNTISHNLDIGIALSGITNTTICHNHIHNNTYPGIMALQTRNMRIIQNYITNNGHVGIFFTAANDSLIQSNNITTNQYHGIYFEHSHHNNVSHNIIANNDYHGIHLAHHSNTNTILYNHVKHNINGMYLNTVAHNEVHDNNMENNDENGVYLHSEANYNNLIRNNISNQPTGVQFLNAHCNLLKNNSVTTNAIGINLLLDSTGNTIEENYIADNINTGVSLSENSHYNLMRMNFLNNPQNAVDSCQNYWNSYPHLPNKKGNYWSDYLEKYPNAQQHPYVPGVWDTPYAIDGGDNFDYYPLIEPVHNHPPLQPNKPTGKSKIMYRTNDFALFSYTSTTADPENNPLYYYFNWGDKTGSGWLGPYPSGYPVTAYHSWEKPGVFKVRVKAKDMYGTISEYSTPLIVSVIYNIVEPIPIPIE